MRKIINIIAAVLTLTAVASCDMFKLDNYDGPNAQVSGKLLDEKTGELIGVEAAFSQEIDWANVKTTFEGHLAEATFPCKCRDGRVIDCKITTFHRDEEPKNVRQITLNGELFDIGGHLDENKIFQMDIKTADGVVERPDMMRLLIRSYLHGCLNVPGRMARQNLEWMLKIIEIAGNK